MGLEGAVRLAYRNELNAIADPDERQKKYESMVASMYARGKALNMATTLEIDNGEPLNPDMFSPSLTSSRHFCFIF